MKESYTSNAIHFGKHTDLGMTRMLVIPQAKQLTTC